MALDLITLNDLVTYLELTSPTENDYLAMLANGVNEAFKRLVGWQVISQTFTHYLDGNWTTRVALPEVPVSSVTSVYLDQSGYDGQGASSPFPATTLLVAGTDYYLQLDRSLGGSASGLLVRTNGFWPGLWSRNRGDLTARRVNGQGNIKVTYVAGYSPCPADIKLALCEACKLIRATRLTQGPIASEGLGEYNYSTANYNGFSLPADILKVGVMQTVVMSYRRLRLR